VNEAVQVHETAPPEPRWLSARARATVVAVSFGLIVLTVGLWLVAHRRDLVEPRSVIDFSSYYAAANALRMNPFANIYDQEVLRAGGAQAGVYFPPQITYPYPLPFAYLLIPLAFLPFSTAAIVFFYINLAIWIACILLMAREIRYLLGGALRGPSAALSSPTSLRANLISDPAPIFALAVSCCVLLVCQPLSHGANLGQITFFVLLPLALIPWLTRRRHERWVGAMIALAALFKIIPALLFAYLLLRRRWQALFTALGVVIAVMLASVALLGWNNVYDLVPLLFSKEIGLNSFAHNQALLAPLLNGIAAMDQALGARLRPLNYLGLGALALGVGIVLWRTWKPGLMSQQKAEQENVAYAVALCAFVSLEPVVWDHYYVWPLIGALLLLAILIRDYLGATASRQRRPIALLLAGLILAIALINLPLPFGLDSDPSAQTPAAWGPAARWILLELRPLGALIVLIIAAFWLLNGERLRGAAPARIPDER
jgi:hypothetical protein